MANNSLSVHLALCCCSYNYLQQVCRMKAQVFHCRKYEFVWSEFAFTALLYCNDICIGIVRKNRLEIYPQFQVVVPSRSYLCSILAMFNLYPL